jgi:choline dehydrogenase
MTQTAFDYIIVGAGSAGCVLANRLSEDPAIHVALIEAGPADKSLLIHMPMGIAQILPPEKNSPLNWNYWTEPQRHLHNRKLIWPRGRVLGGSSSINGMVYIRGSASDYDHWAQLGCTGWGWDDVLPHFKKAEDAAHGDAGYHGKAGPLHTELSTPEHPLTQAFLEAGRLLGLPQSQDFNGAQFEGVGAYHTTTKGGQRWSAAKAYLDPVKDRRNLTIVTNSQAQRVLFEKGRAVGVEIMQGNTPVALHTRREVILCGGAVNSPQLLMLSGIGPASHLASLGIPLVADRAQVGENLQDHLDILLQWTIEQPASLNSNGVFPKNLLVAAQWLLFKTGAAASVPTPAGAFVRSRPEVETPDIQLHFIAGYGLPHGIESARKKQHGYMIHVCQLRPQSRGSIRLASADPNAHPRIDPDYLSAAEDIDVQLAGVALARQLGNAKPFEAFGPHEVFPGAAGDARATLIDAIKTQGETIYHPIGTCRMGSDADAVVDLHLRVNGVVGLRVVDASVMPRLISGNTNAPTIMIAEKAADLIKAESMKVAA